MTCVLGHPFIGIGKISDKPLFCLPGGSAPFLSKSESVLPYSSKYIGGHNGGIFFKCTRYSIVALLKNSAVFATVFSILLLI